MGKSDVEEMVRERERGMDVGTKEHSVGGDALLREAIVVDPERNEAIERDRPEDAIFRAVFGSESENEE